MANERRSSRRRVASLSPRMMTTKRKRVDDFLTLLPDDLLKKILLPIPVESLVSLASTCKRWHDYLTNDDFARLHLYQWRSRYGILYSHSGILVYSPIFDGKANKLILARLEDCFSKSLKEDDQFRVLDSCDGLILIVCDRNRHRNRCLVVCNPLMRSFKFLQLPPTPVWYCHWNMVYDASIKKCKIIGITKEKWIIKNGVRGRRVYILELCRSSSESSEWKEVSVCDDELGGGDFGGEVQKSVLVDEKGKKKKLYYLIYKKDLYYLIKSGYEVRTSLIYIDIETHQVKAVAATACSSMSTLIGKSFWVGSSSTGRFYMSASRNVSEEFNLFVLEDLHNPIWKRRCINRRNVGRMAIRPFAVVQDNGNDEEEKILYMINGKIHEYQIDRGLWRETSNNTEHHFTRRIYYHGNFSVAHLHSLIRI